MAEPIGYRTAKTSAMPTPCAAMTARLGLADWDTPVLLAPPLVLAPPLLVGVVAADVKGLLSLDIVALVKSRENELCAS